MHNIRTNFTKILEVIKSQVLQNQFGTYLKQKIPKMRTQFLTNIKNWLAFKIGMRFVIREQ